jgi:hypothetical protein
VPPGLFHGDVGQSEGEGHVVEALPGTRTSTRLLGVVGVPNLPALSQHMVLNWPMGMGWPLFSLPLGQQEVLSAPVSCTRRLAFPVGVPDWATETVMVSGRVMAAGATRSRLSRDREPCHPRQTAGLARFEHHRRVLVGTSVTRFRDTRKEVVIHTRGDET